MDRDIAISLLLLVGLTWLLYKLVVMLEPRGEKPATGQHDDSSVAPSPALNGGRRPPIHQRLRK